MSNRVKADVDIEVESLRKKIVQELKDRRSRSDYKFPDWPEHIWRLDDDYFILSSPVVVQIGTVFMSEKVFTERVRTKKEAEANAKANNQF